MGTNKISWGLFDFWKRYIKDIKILIGRFFFLIKHGYSPVARWETFLWFTDTMKEILAHYRYDRFGTPIVIDNYFGENGETKEDENRKVFDKIIDEMLYYLNDMNEGNYDYENMTYEEIYTQMENSKNKFFELFSKYFYTLWD